MQWKKIGNISYFESLLPYLQKISYRLAIWVVLQVFFAFNVFADDIQFTASAKSTVSLGERFRLTYSVNAQGTNFRSPAITNFEVLSGPSQSSNSSIQIINGVMTQTVNLSYTFILEANKIGTFTLAPASITVNGKEYKSNPVTITVVGGGSAPATSNQPQQPKTNTQTDVADVDAKDVFIRVSVDKTNPLLGEQIIATYKLYTKIPISQYQINKLSATTGFWSHDLLKDMDKPKQYNEVINGVNYTVAEIRKVALFPQKSGTLTLEPLEVECIAQIRMQSNRNSFFDNFFNDPFFRNPFADTYQNVKKSLKSNALSIQVRSLPSQNVPANFSGVVGVYNLKSSIDKDRITAHDAITLKVTISGTGNISLVDAPKIVFPPDFETFDPKITENITNVGSKIGGTKTFEYLVIPRKGGDFKIKPAEFSYFDLAKNTYVSLFTDEFNIVVEKGSEKETSNQISGISKEDIKYIGSDIRFIHNKPFKVSKTINIFFASALFWIMLVLPVVIFVVIILVWRRNIQLSQDIKRLKNRKATKVAKKRLKKAQSFVKQNKRDLFFEEISKALWGYISDKFGISIAELSIDSAKLALKEIKISEELITKLINLLDECEFERFAPASETTSIAVFYQRAAELITQIEKEIK